VIPLTRTIPGRIRGALRRCAIQINVYFTYLLILLLNERLRHEAAMRRFDDNDRIDDSRCGVEDEDKARRGAVRPVNIARELLITCDSRGER